MQCRDRPWGRETLAGRNSYLFALTVDTAHIQTDTIWMINIIEAIEISIWMQERRSLLSGMDVIQDRRCLSGVLHPSRRLKEQWYRCNNSFSIPLFLQSRRTVAIQPSQDHSSAVAIVILLPTCHRLELTVIRQKSIPRFESSRSRKSKECGQLNITDLEIVLRSWAGLQISMPAEFPWCNDLTQLENSRRKRIRVSSAGALSLVSRAI